MRRTPLAPALVALAFILLLISIRGLRERPFRAGEPAPALVFTDLEGRPASLDTTSVLAAGPSLHAQLLGRLNAGERR